MAKAFFIYGFTEGPWHGRRFKRQLKRRGYDVGRSLERADIIIAHSGGCFDVPELTQNQLLVLINPTYWPERSLTERGINMLRQIARSLKPGRGSIFNLRKSLRNLFYLVRFHKTNQFMARRAKTFNLESEIQHRNTIIIRNDNDPWLTPDLGKLQRLNPHIQIERLPGDHDDCWINPKPYIDIIEKYRA